VAATNDHVTIGMPVLLAAVVTSVHATTVMTVLVTIVHGVIAQNEATVHAPTAMTAVHVQHVVTGSSAPSAHATTVTHAIRDQLAPVVMIAATVHATTAMTAVHVQHGATVPIGPLAQSVQVETIDHAAIAHSMTV
jgi:hypothetical protein